MELIEKFKELCQANGWKNTPQRYRIYCVLHGNLTHPSVDSVLAQVRKDLPTVTRESVYRILNEFAEAGVIVRLDDLNAARYDWNTTPHGHFLCRICGKITDFPLPPDLQILVPGELERTKFSHIELRVAGECPDCMKKNNIKQEKKKWN